MALLHVEIVVVNLQAETNLLDFRGALVAASFTSLDLLVVLELAVINELGDRRLRVRGHLDEIEVCLLGQVSATEVAMTPTCSPFGPIRRTCGTRISSLIRGSSLMMTPILYFNSVARAFAGVLFNALGSWQAKARANMRSASADAYQFFASFLITRCISQSLGCLP